MAELACDTSLSGFPYSDSFIVRNRYVLTRMAHKGRVGNSNNDSNSSSNRNEGDSNGSQGQGDEGGISGITSGEAWCRLEASCRIVWLKNVSVPFLKVRPRSLLPQRSYALLCALNEFVLSLAFRALLVYGSQCNRDLFWILSACG